jgi:hypothetical protein
MAFSHDSKHMSCPLWDRKTRNFVENVATRTVPAYEVDVDVDRVGERLVALQSFS